MDYKQLLYFKTVAEEKSFSKAASQLFLSQQALSKSMERLEKELDLPLFYRGNKGLELTHFGLELRTYANSYVRLHEEMIDHFSKFKAKESKSLSIGYPTGMMVNFPDDFLANFIEAHQEIEFSIYSYPDDSYNRSLQNPKIDVQLCSMIYEDSLLNVEFSFRQKSFAIMSKDHPLVEKGSLTMSDLRDYKLIYLNSENRLTNTLAKACQEHGIKPSVFVCPAEENLIYNYIVKNQYVSFFASHTVDLPPTIVKKKVSDLDVYYEFFIITRKGAVKTSIMKEFIKYTAGFLKVE